MLRSLSLEERLAAASEETASERVDASVDAVLEAWARAVAPSDRAAFQRRLSWDGLDERAVRRGLSREPSPETLSPRWSLWLPRLLSEAVQNSNTWESADDVIASEGFVFEGEPHPPFLELWLPAVKAARGGLKEAKGQSRVSPEAQRSLEKQLLVEVAATAELAVFETYRSFVAGAARPARDFRVYREFIGAMLSSGLTRLFHEFPVLARQIATVIECWVDATRELLERLDADRPALSKLLGVAALGDLAEVEPALSDPHDGRRRVVRLRFETGEVLLYKPRDMCIERDYNGLLQWAVQAGLSPRLPFLRVLARSGYGWVEGARQEDVNEREAVRGFFEKSGALLFVAHLLHGRDLHMENIVATREGPVLVDPEMIFQPERGTESEGEGGSAGERRPSCLETGMLSWIEAGPDGEIYDIGGLRGADRVASPVRGRQWLDHGTSSLHCVEVNRAERTIGNRIHWNGVAQNPSSFAREILSGFVSAYRFFLRVRDRLAPEIEKFTGAAVRVLLRPSAQYAMASRLLREPKYQRSGITGSLVLEALNRGFANRRAAPPLWPAAKYEKETLLRLDIPRFDISLAGRDLPVPGSGALDGYFARSGMETVNGRMRNLSERDLAFQVKALREALESSVEDRFVTALPEETRRPEEPESRRSWLRYALWIGEELRSFRIRQKDVPDLGLGEHREDDADKARAFHLYDGLAGEALFFAALASITGDARWAEPAIEVRQLLSVALEDPETRRAFREDDLGACSGLASVVYGQNLAGHLLRDDSAVELSFALSELIDEERIAKDRSFDVVAGSAGAILVLSALLRHRRDERLLRLIECAAHRLLDGATKTESGLAWLPHGGSRVAGFGHGAAGIALALVRAFEATGEPRCLRAAEEAYRWERSLYSPSIGNWSIPGGEGDIREVVMTAWCNGAPGIGLGRALGRSTLDEAKVDGEIEAALGATVKAPLHPSDHLCCGNLGRSEVLLTVGRRLNRRDWIDAANEIASRVVERAERRGHFRLKSSGFSYPIRSRSFFRGLPGIGYQMLRMAAPSEIPSVLAFEPYREEKPELNQEKTK